MMGGTCEPPSSILYPRLSVYPFDWLIHCSVFLTASSLHGILGGGTGWLRRRW